MKLTPDIIDNIRAQNPIEEIVAEYGVNLRYDNKACCPFHEEDTPSFMVYPDTQTYHCYGCGAGVKNQNLTLKDGAEVVDGGSDVIGFIMNMENLSFPEACKHLMRRVNIPIPDDKVDLVLEKAKDAVMDRNRRYYVNLTGSKDMLDYFKDRGIDNADIKKWRLGYIDPGDKSSPHRGRLVFSIMEEHYRPEDAKTIAMAYRKMDPNDNGPKYKNDPNSNIYNKSSVLYGLNYAAPNIRKKRYAIVMEGYTDVILAHKAGLDNSVATCGTSFTEAQMKKLRRYTDKIFFWYDGDSAGQQAIIRALPGLLKEGFNVLVVESNGEDPADVIQRVGVDNIVQYMTLNSKPAVQLVIDKEVAKFEAILNQERVKTLAKILPIVESISRPADKFNYEHVLKKKLGLS